MLSSGNTDLTRRHVLGGAALSAGYMLTLGRAASGMEMATDTETEEAKVTPGEDLMREHAVLDRLLLIYEYLISSTGLAAEPMAEALTGTTQLVRSFIGEYHEKLEENFIFPAFGRAGKHVPLVAVLRAQHGAGRQLTDAIERHAEGLTDSSPRQRLARDVRSFIRMYRPHAAHEGTVLFPDIRSIVAAQEYQELAERFEDIEHERFGEAGFRGVVAQVEEIEKKLSIHDLARFTP